MGAPGEVGQHSPNGMVWLVHGHVFWGESRSEEGNLKFPPDHPIQLFQWEWLKLRIGDLLQWELFNLDLDQFSKENPDLKREIWNFPQKTAIQCDLGSNLGEISNFPFQIWILLRKLVQVQVEQFPLQQITFQQLTILPPKSGLDFGPFQQPLPYLVDAHQPYQVQGLGQMWSVSRHDHIQ